MTKTITIQIGNSDDKLSQRDWSLFVYNVGGVVSTWGGQIHFHGHSDPESTWQNCCWVVNNEEEEIEAFKQALLPVKEKYGQDSIAFTVGETLFI